MDWLPATTIFTIFHLFGVALGAGGAYMSDLIFFNSVKDERISATEMRFMKLGSRAVWVGLAILFISGLMLFLGKPEVYLESTKFLAKITIIFIIFLNGLVFHTMHLPRLERHTDAHYPSSDEFMRKRSLLMASGAVSFLSWTSAVILGAIQAVPYSYPTIMAFYLAVVTCAVIFTLVVFRHRPHKTSYAEN